jgi:group I intron endonuclease
MVGVYKITNQITGDCYVGQSKHVEKRWKEHFCKGYGAMHSKLFQDHIDHFGIESFTFELLEECKTEELREKERYWIAELRPEYNTVVVGHPVSEETRAKISASLTGKKHPPEVVEKRKASIREYRKTHPQINAGHRKKVAIQTEAVMEFESIKACAEYLGVEPSSVTRALKRGWKLRGHKVWYVV